MKYLIGIVVQLCELLFLLGMCALIGLWWVPISARTSLASAFLTATVALVVGGEYFRRNILLGSTIFRLGFYAVLLGGAVMGYLYGIFFRWVN